MTDSRDGSQSAIDAYLDDLLARLHGPADRVRRIVAEAEAHLRDAADANEAAGMDPAAAESAAVERFGSPAVVASAANRSLGAASPTQLVTATGWLAAKLCAVGLVAVGLSGPLATALAAIVGRGYVFGLPAGVSMPGSACAHWLAVQAGASGCAQAGMFENADDTLGLRVAAGVLGLLLTGGLLLLRRIGRRPVDVLPRGFGATVGGTVFGCAAVVLFVLGLSDSVVALNFGQGQWYVDSLISLVVSVWFFAGLLRRLRSPAAPAVTALTT